MGTVEQDTLQGFARFADIATDMPKVFGEILQSVSQKWGQKADYHALMKSMNEHLADNPNYLPPCFVPKDFALKDFEDEFHALGGKGMVSGRVVKGPYTGTVVAFVREEDMLLAQIAKERALSIGQTRMDELGNVLSNSVEVSLPTLKYSASKNGYPTLMQLPAMDEVKANMLSEQFRVNGVMFSKVEQEGDAGETRQAFYCNPKDRKKVESCLARTEVEFDGISGTRQHMIRQNEVDAITKSMNYIGANKATRNFYVVSGTCTSNVIEVSGDNLNHQTIRKDGTPQIMRKVKGQEDFSNLARVYKQEVSSMRAPVVLEKDEYEAVKDDKEALEKLVQEKRKFPMYASLEEKAQILFEKEVKNAYIRKVSMTQLVQPYDAIVDKMMLQDVMNGDMTLENYLVSGTNADPDADIAKWSEEEKSQAADLIKGYIERYEHVTEQIIDKEVDIEDLDYKASLDDMLNDIQTTNATHALPEAEPEVGD